MLPLGYQNLTALKANKVMKIRTCSGEDDRKIKKSTNIHMKIYDSNNKPFKDFKRSSEFVDQSQFKTLSSASQNKENIRKELEQFKSQIRYGNRVAAYAAYDSLKGDRRVEKQNLSTDRKLGRINPSVYGVPSKIGKATLRYREFSGQSKFVSTNGLQNQRKQSRTIKRSEKTNNNNYMKVKTPMENLPEKKALMYQAYSLKGSKQFNQDSVKAGDGIWIVCDGHGQNGHHVSWYIVNVLYEVFQYRKSKERITKALLNEIFIDAEKHLEESGIEIGLSGSTCVLVAMEGEKIFCACLGDSVAIAITDENDPIVISSQHKPCNPQEAKRIEFFGGVVKRTTGKEHIPGSPLRMWGQGLDDWGPGLAISRSFGDMMGQKYGLIYEPEIKEIEKSKNLKYIVLGSDGLFDQVSPPEIGDILRTSSQKKQGCRKLAETAQSRWVGYSDDISAIVVYL